MRIFKGSSITLELPVHVCGAGNFSIEKVVIYTDNPNNAVEFRNHMLIDEVLHVYVNSNSLDILNDGVINYIVEGDGIHIEKMSSYFLKTPKDYTALSLELEKREVTVNTNNNTTTITKNPQYFGIEEVKVTVNIPTQDVKTVNIVKNGTTEVLPDEGYDYIRKVNINTDVILKSLPIVPSQISFSGSTWEEFDMGLYDWKYVYNWSVMFSNCSNLKRLLNFPQDARAYGTTDFMFYNCKIEEAPYFDTQFIGGFNNMFTACINLTTVPQYDLRNALTIQGMFNTCQNLTSLPQFYCPKLKTATEIFGGTTCSNLTDVGGWREIRCNLDLKKLPNLTPQSIINVIEGLYDFEYWAEEPDSTQGTLTLATSLSSVVTEEMMADATNKKWKIIFS